MLVEGALFIGMKSKDLSGMQVRRGKSHMSLTGHCSPVEDASIAKNA
jgi:hypothetical protein